jgi:putative heme-binding domain-containing protein
MGSWVALTTDPKGRLIASDQGGAGLFIITPGSESEPTRVEKLPVNLSGAQGLLWAFDALYAVVNGGDKSGLHRLTDTNGDGLVDADEHCMFVPGGGEHGPHAVILSPDGKSLFVASGNHTKLPDAIVGSKIPQNWNEDHLLPRRWDANGHAAGILAPGGWICNVDPTGKEWNVFSMGYRNQYDIAFDPQGELFTYDADMEWDFGSPWYRPTRVCHATSGSEFGWRSGTGKWPVYYEDSLPPVVEIGPGSPTGIVFGTGAKFPARYQQALFILDWTYSTIYTIDMVQEGSTFKGTKSDFVTGSPLPVTDAIVGNDGTLYFAAGGRGTQSSVYRVTYVGKESTAPVAKKPVSQLQALRHQLETFHGNANGDLKLILANLGHEDRFIRYAARIALENQPLDRWKELVFGSASQTPKFTLNAMLAVARQGSAKDLDRLLQKLTSLTYGSLSEQEKLTYLRTMQVAFARHGSPSAEWRTKLASQLDAVYPADSYPLNAELVQLLVYLESPTVVTKTLTLMDNLGPEPIPEWGYLVERNAGYGGTVGQMLADMPPVRAIHFAFVLRNAKVGWSIAQRTKYFQFFVDAVKHPGGNSYGKFLSQFRDDALATCSAEEKIVLDSLASQSLMSETFKSTPPKGPGRKWTKAEALAAVDGGLSKRSFESGRNLFHATSCAKCHRLSGDGGSIGPDLSTASKKFSVSDMLDSIIEPSKAISDQYGSQQVITTSGKVLIGRVVEIGDETYVYTAEVDAKPVVLTEDDIEDIKPSPVSQMPTGLVDTLSADELKDLLAYLMAAGDPNAALYK